MIDTIKASNLLLGATVRLEYGIPGNFVNFKVIGLRRNERTTTLHGECESINSEVFTTFRNDEDIRIIREVNYIATNE